MDQIYANLVDAVRDLLNNMGIEYKEIM